MSRIAPSDRRSTSARRRSPARRGVTDNRLADWQAARRRLLERPGLTLALHGALCDWSHHDAAVMTPAHLSQYAMVAETVERKMAPSDQALVDAFDAATRRVEDDVVAS